MISPVSDRRPWSVGRQLAVGLLPALLAVALVLALAVWGEYGRQEPEAVVAGAAVLAVVSLALTWRAARDLARRLARLASTVATVRSMLGEGVADGSDELEHVEDTMERLRVALVTAERARTDAAQQAAAEARAQARLVEQTVRQVRAMLDDVQLPVHILLDSRFGGLNENQEELLAATRDAAERMDHALRRLETVATADADGLSIHAAAVSPNDLVRAVEPQIRALAERQQRAVVLDLEPALPRVWADRAKLATALVLLAEIGARESRGGELRVRTRRSPESSGAEPRSEIATRVLIELEPFPAEVMAATGVAEREDADTVALDAVLASRLLRAHGVRLSQVGRSLRLELPPI